MALSFLSVGIWSLLASCGGPVRSSASPAGDISAVQARHEAELLNLAGVVGVGIGECDRQPCIKVLVEQRTPELDRQVPARLEGLMVVVEETGSFEALPR